MTVRPFGLPSPGTGIGDGGSAGVASTRTVAERITRNSFDATGMLMQSKSLLPLSARRVRRTACSISGMSGRRGLNLNKAINRASHSSRSRTGPN